MENEAKEIICPFKFVRDFAIKVPEPMAIRNYIISEYIKPVYDIKPHYHYTDLSGFMGILDGKELWATNTRYLNDRNECKQGLIQCLEIVQEYSIGQGGKCKEYLQQLYTSILGRIKKNDIHNIYTISFCQNGDLLSQWRGYGKKGGIAIGFNLIDHEMELEGKMGRVPFGFLDRNFYDSVTLEKRNSDEFHPNDGEWWIHLYKVLYDEQEQNEILKDLVDIGIEAIKQGVKGIVIEELATAIVESLEFVLPIIKNKGFQEEQELRYIWRDDGTRKIYFRERNGVIVPYIRCMIRDCNCKTLPELPIEDIIVGPQNNQSEVIDSIKFYLQQKGYEYLADKVRASKIPYRE